MKNQKSKMKTVNTGNIICIFLALSLTACITTEQLVKGRTVIKQPVEIERIKEAFDKAEEWDERNSKWFYGRKTSLELTIIAPVYHSPDEKESIAYKKLYNFLKMVSDDPAILDKASDLKISKMFTKIRFVPFKLGSKENKRYESVYRKQFHDKQILNDILRDYDDKGNEKNSMELSIRIDPDDLKKNVYTISGYKTVKEPGLERNSYYYHLSKKSSDGTNDNDIVNAIVAAFTLSIPQYASIDRKGLMGKIIRIIKNNPDGTYTGEVYTHEVKIRIAELKEKLDSEMGMKGQISQNEKEQINKKYNQIIDHIKSIKYQTRQVLLTTPIIQKDLDFLYLGGYLQQNIKYNTFNYNNISEIISIFKLNIPDEILSITLLEIFGKKLNKFKYNIEGKEYIKKALHIIPDKNLINQGDTVLYLTSKLDMEDMGFDKIIKLKFISLNSVQKEIRHKQGAYTIEISAFRSKDSVSSVIFSPDGKYVLSGGHDQTMRLWEIGTDRIIRDFEGHTEEILAISFSPDGKYVISGSGNGDLKLWETDTGRKIKTMKGHLKAVSSVSFSPNGKYVLSGSGDKTLKLWDIDKGKEIRTFYGHMQWITSTDFSPDGRYALSGSRDDTMMLWDIKAGKVMKTFDNHKSDVTSVVFSPDGRHALSGSRDNTMKLWDIERGKEIKTFQGHQKWIESVAFSPDGKYGLSGSWDNTVKLWSIERGKEIKTFQGHTEPVYTVSFNPDGESALSGSQDGFLIFWSINLTIVTEKEF